MTKHIFRVPVDVVHFKDTIEIGKPYTTILPFFPAEEKLKNIAVNGMVRYWGTMPGLSNNRVFKLMQEADELLFYRSGRYIALADVAFSMVNPALARWTWGETQYKTTWELIYFLREVEFLKLDAYVLNEAFGIKGGPVMGFSVFSEDRASKFMETHGSVRNYLKSLQKAA